MGLVYLLFSDIVLFFSNSQLSMWSRPIELHCCAFGLCAAPAEQVGVNMPCWLASNHLFLIAFTFNVFPDCACELMTILLPLAPHICCCCSTFFLCEYIHFVFSSLSHFYKDFCNSHVHFLIFSFFFHHSPGFEMICCN